MIGLGIGISEGFGLTELARALVSAGFFAPLTSSLVPQVGAGSATFTRASTATQTDFEGLVKTALSGEARFQGARRVANLVVTQNLTYGSWFPGTNITATSANILTSTDPTTFRRTTAAIAGATIGKTYRFTADVTWMSGGSGLARVSLDLGGSLNPTNIQFMLGVKQRITFSYTAASVTSAYFEFYQDALTVFKVENIMGEDVTGQTNQNPSEYVSNGVLSAPYHGAGVDGVKYFPYLNGNTVDANGVVTEAQGAAIPASTLLGYLSEGAATNYFLNSGAPVTQTITLAAGTYVTWMTGTGSITTSAGTATASGYGVASAGTPNTIVVTVAGTVVFTVAGTVTQAQVENTAFATSYIPTTTVAVTRNADVLSYLASGNVNSTAGSIYSEVQFEGITATIQMMVTSDTAYPMYKHAVGNLASYDGTNPAIRDLSATVVANTSYKFATSYGSGQSVCRAGNTVYTGVFDGSMNFATNIYIGNSAATGQLYGTIKNVRIWQTQLSDTLLQAITA